MANKRKPPAAHVSNRCCLLLNEGAKDTLGVSSLTGKVFLGIRLTSKGPEIYALDLPPGTMNVVQLAGGRRVSWSEVGDPQGTKFSVSSSGDRRILLKRVKV